MNFSAQGKSNLTFTRTFHLAYGDFVLLIILIDENRCVRVCICVHAVLKDLLSFRFDALQHCIFYRLMRFGKN